MSCKNRNALCCGWQSGWSHERGAAEEGGQCDAYGAGGVQIEVFNDVGHNKDIEGIKISENAESLDGIEGLKAFSEKRKPNFNE